MSPECRLCGATPARPYPAGSLCAQHERRRSLVTPTRARAIRAEIEADAVATLRAEVPAERGGCVLCGRAPGVACYLPERVCRR